MIDMVFSDDSRVGPDRSCQEIMESAAKSDNFAVES
jgi:hypothetical protein